MQRVGDNSHREPPGRYVVQVSVSSGDRRPATAQITRYIAGAGVTVQSETPATDGFAGQFFSSTRPGRRPAVVVWGGSEGGFGLSPILAGLLASHGIAALAVGYFGSPGLPASLSLIPLEYFAKAIS